LKLCGLVSFGHWIYLFLRLLAAQFAADALAACNQTKQLVMTEIAVAGEPD